MNEATAEPKQPASFGASPSTDSGVSRSSSKSPRPRALRAALIGAGLYLVALLSHIASVGGIKERLGCVVPLEYPILNLAAQGLHTVLPNPWLSPQNVGEELPLQQLSASQWSPLLWVLSGLCFWAAAAALAALAIAHVRARLSRARAA